jgi:hypothetical protein
MGRAEDWIMSGDSSLDRTFFQQFLASAFAVQESRMDSGLLATMVSLHRLVAQGELGVDGVMNLIVESAQEVAGAAGVAIGLLEKDQLIYRAGSGCSALRIGSRVAASLTVSTKIKTSREILRVESAHADKSIQGAICRQFGAESLLMLPIYHDRILVGVLEILFSEPHSYQDSEVQMYRLMAGLVEEVMCRTAQAERSRMELPAVSNALEERPKSEAYFTEEQPIFSVVNNKGIYERCGAALAAFRESPTFGRPALLAGIAVQRATEVIANKPMRSLVLSVVVIGLGLTFWMVHRGRGPASDSEPPARSSGVTSLRPNVIPVDGASKGRSVPTPVKPAKIVRMRTPRGRMGQTDVEYIGDDVTVRHFNYKAAGQQTASHVAYMGNDVTVRYFAAKPALSSASR